MSSAPLEFIEQLVSVLLNFKKFFRANADQRMKSRQKREKRHAKTIRWSSNNLLNLYTKRLRAIFDFNYIININGFWFIVFR